MKVVIQYLSVAGGGACGAMLRLFVNTLGARAGLGPAVGTFAVNITGSILLGWFLATIAGREISEATRLGIAVGFVGAYTTFSTFMFESNALVGQGAYMKATVNLVGSVVVGLWGVRIGLWLGKAM